MNSQQQWKFLQERYRSRTLAHAYILSGNHNESLRMFADRMVRYMHCLSTDKKEKACMLCDHCRMIEKKIFSDTYYVRSSDSDSSQKNEKDMLSIEIDQIRSVQHFLSMRSHYGGYKTVIIEDAERMTKEAQHSFLKNLEEPKGQTVIFFLSTKPDLLLPTITSRCQNIQLGFEEVEKGRGSAHEVIALLRSDLAQKFQYTKNVDIDGDRFRDILIELERHFRTVLMRILTIKAGESEFYSIDRVKKILTLIASIHRQALLGTINQKLALEMILLET